MNRNRTGQNLDIKDENWRLHEKFTNRSELFFYDCEQITAILKACGVPSSYERGKRKFESYLPAPDIWLKAIQKEQDLRWLGKTTVQQTYLPLIDGEFSDPAQAGASL